SLSSDKADIVNIQKLWLDGSGQMIYDSRMRMPLYDYVPNTESVKDIIKAMHQNLELIDHKNITEFSFSINEPYEQKVIGEGPYKTGYEVVKSNIPADQTTKTEKENTKVKDEDEEGEGSYTTGNNTGGNGNSSGNGNGSGSGNGNTDPEPTTTPDTPTTPDPTPPTTPDPGTTESRTGEEEGGE
ncbi:MAG: hypothetical protein IIZ67_01660, partial [Bacilli bacterium]|nr:hypothetical protein [Bacilli bacterium]